MPDPLRPPTAIPGNRWDLLRSVAVSGDDPHVSVCIPTRNGGPPLVRTLRMLALQTYPMDLLEVVVADDGSSPAFEIDAATLPYRLLIVRQEGHGFGAGRARNLAASTASGEVLVFLDGDVIPEVGVVRDYVSWIRRHPLCVPFGFSRFVDLSAVSDESLAEALRTGDVDRLVDPTDVDSQEYREPFLRLTHDLTIERLDLFRVFVAATFAVRAEFFASVGGFRELGVRGVEDVELGYRLANQGALLVPVRSAQHWHQGRRTMSGTRVAEIRRERKPFIERLLPVGGFRPERPLGPGPVAPVCRFIAHVDAEVGGDSAVARSIRRMPPEDVQLADQLGVGQEQAFADVFLPADVIWSARTGEALIQAFEDFGVGTLLLVSDAHPPMVVRRRRAVHRARAVDEAAVDELADELFGVAAIVAADVGLVDPSTGTQLVLTCGRIRLARWWRRVRSLVGVAADTG